MERRTRSGVRVSGKIRALSLSALDFFLLIKSFCFLKILTRKLTQEFHWIQDLKAIAIEI